MELKIGPQMDSKKKILFIANALPELKLKTDTSLALAESALENDYAVYWCEKEDIVYMGHEIVIQRHSVVKKITAEQVEHTASEGSLLFQEFSACFIRTDPPFDDSYRDMCWILNTQTHVPIYNSPASLLNFHEKSLHWRAQAEGFLQNEESIPTCVAEHVSTFESFILSKPISQTSQFVVKPFHFQIKFLYNL